MSNTQTAEADIVESGPEQVLTPGELRQQHNENKITLDNLLKGVYRGNGARPQSAVSAERQEKRLNESGLNLDHIPEFLRPAYVKVYNLVQGPASRLERNRAGVEEIVTQLESIEEEVTKALYGGNYTGLSGRLGGLHREYQTMADDRFKCAKAINALREEANATHQRIRKTEAFLGPQTEPGEIKETNEILIGYRFDLERYEGIRGDLEGDLDGYDKGIRYLQRDIEAATHFRNYVRSISQKARNALKVNQGTRSQVGYTEAIAELIPALQRKLEEHFTMAKDFKEKSDGDLGRVISITQQPLDVPVLEEDGPSPFHGMQVEDEKQSERISQRVDEILRKPYGDIYKVNV